MYSIHVDIMDLNLFKKYNFLALLLQSTRSRLNFYCKIHETEMKSHETMEIQLQILRYYNRLFNYQNTKKVKEHQQWENASN